MKDFSVTYERVNERGQPRAARQISGARVVTACQWFRNCNREAVTTVHHPALGSVPCCDRCADFAAPIPAPDWDTLAEYCQRQARAASDPKAREWWQRFAGNVKRAADM